MLLEQGNGGWEVLVGEPFDKVLVRDSFLSVMADRVFDELPRRLGEFWQNFLLIGHPEGLSGRYGLVLVSMKQVSDWGGDLGH